jgi:ABC-type oligopeptide transport system substrate-binding subunit
VLPTIFYYSFNMEDETVGGLTPEKRKLRQALSIALNQEEYNQIFLNGRGISAMGPLPPGIYGHQEGKDGINPFVYRWDEQRQRPVRRNIEEARQLLAEAGYPGGRDRETGEKLVVYLDTTDSFADPPVVAWLRKVFKELGVDLKPRITDYSTFRSKADRGNWQILIWGWNADYPDPENFFFLFYGPNSRIRSQGENVANYQNPEFDKLFKQMETMPNGPERLAIIKKMTRMLQEDSPWIWGFYPKAFGLYHQWYHNAKAMPFGENTLKYKRVDDDLREKKIAEWNVPVTWPVRLVLSLLVLSFIPAAVTIYNRDRKAPGTVEPAEVDPTVSGT